MNPHTEDRLVDIAEAAEILHTSIDYLYRHHHTLPFTVRLSPRQLRFSVKGILKYIEEMQHGGAGVRAS